MHSTMPSSVMVKFTVCDGITNMLSRRLPENGSSLLLTQCVPEKVSNAFPFLLSQMEELRAEHIHGLKEALKQGGPDIDPLLEAAQKEYESEFILVCLSQNFDSFESLDCGFSILMAFNLFW